MDSKVDGSAFSCLNNFFLYLLRYLCYNLLYTRWVDTSILYKLMQ